MRIGAILKRERERERERERFGLKMDPFGEREMSGLKRVQF